MKNQTNFNVYFNLKGIAYKKTAKSHVFLLKQINYPYIVWNNSPKFYENRTQ